MLFRSESVENAIFRLILEFFGETPPPRPAGPEPRKPGFSATQRIKPRILKTLLKTSQNFPPRFPLIFPSPAPKVLHKNPVTGKNQSSECSVTAREGVEFPAE